jgi:biotin/methionine sulfoxide reductase
LQSFRAAPASHPLRTPSGKIEIFSATIDKMKLEDCAGHPAWFEPAEWAGLRACRRIAHDFRAT